MPLNRDIRKALLRLLRPVLGSPAVDVIADIALAIRNLVRPSKVLRLEYFYRPAESPRMRAKIKIEVNNNRQAPFAIRPERETLAVNEVDLPVERARVDLLVFGAALAHDPKRTPQGHLFRHKREYFGIWILAAGPAGSG